ncbi:hypothetical protein Z043_119917 [Scleropages formosus]|uniref:Uncharacterized protein n=1 Tax=Scleropages formosus TaxID=113540 RepID=A0A0P7U4B5_SCLFO|nr:hypothetical protein Z043_119917 [Scleropages formosus]
MCGAVVPPVTVRLKEPGSGPTSCGTAAGGVAGAPGPSDCKAAAVSATPSAAPRFPEFLCVVTRVGPSPQGPDALPRVPVLSPPLVMRNVTGRWELQRICHGNQPGARRTLKIEPSLKFSKCEVSVLRHGASVWLAAKVLPGTHKCEVAALTRRCLRCLRVSCLQLLQAALGAHLDLVEKVIDGIVSLKRIDAESSPQCRARRTPSPPFPRHGPLLSHARLGVSLQASLLQIEGYPSLVLEVEKLRREPYDCSNVEHEEMLLKSRLWCPSSLPLTSDPQLWKCLRPETPSPPASPSSGARFRPCGTLCKRGVGVLGVQRGSVQAASRMRNVETWPLLAYWLELLPLGPNAVNIASDTAGA